MNIIILNYFLGYSENSIMQNPVLLNKVISNNFICLLLTFLKKEVLITSFDVRFSFQTTCNRSYGPTLINNYSKIYPT